VSLLSFRSKGQRSGDCAQQSLHSLYLLQFGQIDVRG